MSTNLKNKTRIINRHQSEQALIEKRNFLRTRRSKDAFEIAQISKELARRENKQG